MNATTYGLDVAKSVFQLHWVDAQTGEIVNRRFTRGELIKFLSFRLPGRVALEACGSGHWWARKIRTMGHEVVLLHAKFIRPFVQTNKTDAGDARAIWTAVHQPSYVSYVCYFWRANFRKGPSGRLEAPCLLRLSLQSAPWTRLARNSCAEIRSQHSPSAVPQT